MGDGCFDDVVDSSCKLVTRVLYTAAQICTPRRQQRIDVTDVIRNQMRNQMYICHTQPRTPWMLPFTIICIILTGVQSVSCTDTDHDHYHIDGYTFVIDDLVWLTVIIVSASLLVWMCCCMDPLFTTPAATQPCYKPLPARDPVIHVKIDGGCCGKTIAKQKRDNQSTNADNGALTVEPGDRAYLDQYREADCSRDPDYQRT